MNASQALPRLSQLLVVCAVALSTSLALAGEEQTKNDGLAHLIVRVVQDPSGAPLEGAEVLSRLSHERDGMRRRTSASGEVAFARMNGDPVTIHVTHKDYATPRALIDLKLVVGQTKTITIRLETGVTVHGTVLRNDVPVAGARVLAIEGGRTERDGASWVSRLVRRDFGPVQTDDKGRFVLTQLPRDEVCSVLMRVPGMRHVKHGFLPKRAAALDDGIVIQLVPGARLSGRVLDPKGQPVAGARVRIDGQKDLTSETNADGVYQFDGLDFDRSYTVVAYAREFAKSVPAKNVRPTKGASTTILDLTLRQPGSLRVRLVDSAGMPIVTAKTTVFLGSTGERAKAGDKPGSWLFTRMAPGTHWFKVKAPGYLHEGRSVMIRAGQETDESVSLRTDRALSGK